MMSMEEIVSIQQKNQQQAHGLGQQVNEVLDRYFALLGNQQPENLYQKLMAEIEKPMIESIMRYVRGNQSKAARVLGISRGTLRKKLAEYFDTTHVGKQRD